MSFSTEGIAFARYPYPGASVHPSGRLAWSAVREVDPDAAPPEVRTETGEVLFVAATLRNELRAAAEHNGIPIVQRTDVWGLILEPFVDTEFTPAAQESTSRALADVGLDPEQVERLRARFEARMLAYNAIHWDWVHLGQADLLEAHRVRWAPGWLRFAHRRFVRLYEESMEIAALGERGRG